MNSTELKVEMLRNDDTGVSLSEALGLSKVQFSKKMNAKAEFSQSEIQIIISRYNLSPERTAEIFFSKEVS